MLDKEKNALRKNSLSSLEIGSETSLGIPTDKRGEFLICQACFWCASCFNFDELSVISCPISRGPHRTAASVKSIKSKQTNPLTRGC
jgi:hypothetical protein